MNGRIGNLPLEIIALVFLWLSVMNPMGESDGDAPSEPDEDDDEDSSDDEDDDDEGIDNAGIEFDFADFDHGGDEYEEVGESSGEDGDESADDTEDNSELGSELDERSVSAWSCASSDLTPDIRVAYTIGWARVTQVCSLWREIALSHPALWATVPMHMPLPWISALLERSKQAPLTVLFIGGEVSEVHLLSEHASWLPRARSILYHQLPASILCTLFQSSATPLLKHLDVDDILDIFPASVVEAARSDALESLSIQALDRLPRREQGFSPSFLTSLRLGAVTRDMIAGSSAGVTPTVEEFISFLRPLEHLELLELHGFLPAAPQSAEVEPIALPRLQHTAITDHYTRCAFFLRHVITPADTTVRIDYLGVACEDIRDLALGCLASRETLEALSIGSIVQSAYRDAPSLQQVHIKGCYREGVSLTESGTLRRLPLDADIYITLTTEGENPSRRKPWVQGLCRAICSQITLERLRTLSLDVDGLLNVWATQGPVDDRRRSADNVSMWNAVQWIDILAAARSVWHLEAFSRPSEEVMTCSAVVDLLHAIEISPGLLPSLEALDLVDLSPDYALAGAFDALVSSLNAAQYLKNILDTRPGLTRVNLVRRLREDFKDKWRSREWIGSEELKGRIRFIDQAFDDSELTL